MSIVSFSIRIDESLYEKLTVIAKEEYRSRNKQIDYILKQFVENYERENREIPVNPNE